MTKDNFDYFTDEQFRWTGILDFYTGTNFVNKKGTIFSIEVIIDKKFELLDTKMLKMLGSSWTWGEDRRIKAFKLLGQEINDMRIFYKFQTLRKSLRHDEIKYFLFDLGAYLDHSSYKINDIKVEESM